MARKQHLHHFIYKTTCIITNRFYIGMHSTSDMNDGYMGSGKRLWNSIRKHGKINHKIEYLEFYTDRNSLKTREAELINEDLLKDPLCMNLTIGGEGGSGKGILNGFYGKTHSKEAKDKFVKKSSETKKELYKNPAYKEKVFEKRKETILEKFGSTPPWNWNGKTHNNETKRKMSDIAKLRTSEQNSQFGTYWINNQVESRKIRKEELDQYIKNGWIKGRLSFKN